MRDLQTPVACKYKSDHKSCWVFIKNDFIFSFVIDRKHFATDIESSTFIVRYKTIYICYFVSLVVYNMLMRVFIVYSSIRKAAKKLL